MSSNEKTDNLAIPDHAMRNFSVTSQNAGGLKGIRYDRDVIGTCNHGHAIHAGLFLSDNKVFVKKPDFDIPLATTRQDLPQFLDTGANNVPPHDRVRKMGWEKAVNSAAGFTGPVPPHLRSYTDNGPYTHIVGYVPPHNHPHLVENVAAGPTANGVIHCVPPPLRGRRMGLNGKNVKFSLEQHQSLDFNSSFYGIEEGDGCLDDDFVTAPVWRGMETLSVADSVPSKCHGGLEVIDTPCSEKPTDILSYSSGVTADKLIAIELPSFFACNECGRNKSISSFSSKHYPEYRYRKLTNPTYQPTARNSSMKCRKCTGEEVHELQCWGQCGLWKSPEEFPKSQRVLGTFWCKDCVDWKASLDPGHRLRQSLPTHIDQNESIMDEKRTLEKKYMIKDLEKQMVECDKEYRHWLEKTGRAALIALALFSLLVILVLQFSGMGLNLETVNLIKDQLDP